MYLGSQQDDDDGDDDPLSSPTRALASLSRRFILRSFARGFVLQKQESGTHRRHKVKLRGVGRGGRMLPLWPERTDVSRKIAFT